jgi:hypothetical protein
MAGAGVVSHAGGREAQYEGRVTAHVVWACIVAASGGLLFGYDTGISGSCESRFAYNAFVLTGIFGLDLREES